MNVVLMLVFLIVGFVLLVKGADFFVDGACDLSEKLKIPAYIVGLTVVAFGTSLPEAAVSITASLQHSNAIAIGNVIGSNTFNTLVVLGASALFAPVVVKKNILKRDLPFCGKAAINFSQTPLFCEVFLFFKESLDNVRRQIRSLSS